MKMTLATATLNIVGECNDDNDLDRDDYDFNDPAILMADDLMDQIEAAARTLCEEHGFTLVRFDE